MIAARIAILSSLDYRLEVESVVVISVLALAAYTAAQSMKDTVVVVA